MPTLAEKLAKKPTKALQAIADEVQAVADQSQSFAYRFEDFEDGSRLEIRCAPVPHLAEIPDDHGQDHAGSLAQVAGQTLRVFPQREIARAAGDLGQAIAACDEVIANSEDPAEIDEVSRYRDAAVTASSELRADLDVALRTESHVALPTDAKTIQFLDELGPGGRTFIAHRTA